MPFKRDGQEDAERRLKRVEEGARELKDTKTVSIHEIFLPAFMQENTDFNNIDEFFEQSPFTVTSEEDFKAVDEKELDEYIDSHTRFESWEKMLGVAGEAYVVRKLG